MVVVQLGSLRAYVLEITVRSFRLIIRTFPNITDKSFDINEAFNSKADEIDEIASQFITIKNRLGRTKKLSSLNEQQLYDLFLAVSTVNPDIFKKEKGKAVSATSEDPIPTVNTGIDSDIVTDVDVSILTLARLGYGEILDMPYSLLAQAMVHAQKK